MAFKFFLKQSPKTKPPQFNFTKSCSLSALDLVATCIVIVINVVIGEFSGVTVSLQPTVYNFEQNKAVYAPLTFVEIVIITINCAIGNK